MSSTGFGKESLPLQPFVIYQAQTSDDVLKLEKDVVMKIQSFPKFILDGLDMTESPLCHVGTPCGFYLTFSNPVVPQNNANAQDVALYINWAGYSIDLTYTPELIPIKYADNQDGQSEVFDIDYYMNSIDVQILGLSGTQIVFQLNNKDTQ
eukprot:UN07448